MSSDGVPFLLVTANVGSIFEEPSVMLKVWTEEFLSTVARLDPKFIALHCQEVGGKNYAESMRHVEEFVRLLMNSEELRLFDKVRVFLDEDFSSAEHFTALGNLYFAHETLKDVLLWDFKEGTFVPVSGKEIHSGNIEAVTTKEKAKFPQDFFPECKWSRKGFLRTRWNIRGTVFDLINIHLFHDASNFIAMETFPSVYSKTRRRALEHTLDRFHNDHYPNAPYFLFGDFNFRTDTAGVIKKLTADTRETQTQNKGSLSKMQFRNESDDLILTLGKKEFSHHEHQQVFVEDDGQWLHEYDKELGDFDGRLFEFPISFVPSYPFEEDVAQGANYMLTRVPAWCDRVLLSPTAKSLVKDISETESTEYGIIGPTTCMGDHKPVYLRLTLAPDAGTINCCSLAEPGLCFRVPASYLASERLPCIAASTSPAVPLLPGCRSCAAASFSQSSPHLLHAAPLKHDPYTPDSMDSPSPSAIAAAPASGPEDEELPPKQQQKPQPPQEQTRPADRAVSPELLKSKLELIVERRRRDRSGSLSNSNSDEEGSAAQEWPGRKSRSNSDVSWQRSHLLTRAWLQGKGQQAYRSFSSDLLGQPLPTKSGEEQQQQELVIPRIAIINASNFVSNASSVHLHDDCARKLSCTSSQRSQQPSEQYLDTLYSNTRTRSLSEADSSQDRTPVEDDQEPGLGHGNRELEEELELKESRIVVIGDAKLAADLDSKQDAAVTSKNTTRSNSIQSQDANVSLKLKAYNKVTERCKRNIVDKKSRCEKCCVVS